MIKVKVGPEDPQLVRRGSSSVQNARYALNESGWNRSGARTAAPAARNDQGTYLNDSETRARYATTLPSSTFMSSFVTSAMRRSRSVFAAVDTAVLAASSQDMVLVPTTSTIL